MTTYKCQWISNTEFEYDEFSIGLDPDPPAKWKCDYRFYYGGEAMDYWVILPKKIDTYAGRDTYVRRHEIINRDLAGSAIGATCELLSAEKIEIEPWEPAMTRLALNIERSRAILAGRETRRFISITVDNCAPLVDTPSHAEH